MQKKLQNTPEGAQLKRYEYGRGGIPGSHSTQTISQHIFFSPYPRSDFLEPVTGGFLQETTENIRNMSLSKKR